MYLVLLSVDDEPKDVEQLTPRFKVTAAHADVRQQGFLRIAVVLLWWVG